MGVEGVILSACLVDGLPGESPELEWQELTATMKARASSFAVPGAPRQVLGLGLRMTGMRHTS
jgi:hypothetical protein